MKGKNRITHTHHGITHIYELAFGGGLIFIERVYPDGKTSGRKVEAWRPAVGPPDYLAAIESALRAMCGSSS